MKRPVVLLLHLGYWLLFLFLLLVFFILAMPMLDKSYQVHRAVLLQHWATLMAGFAIVPGLIAFYSFYTFLFTRFLKQNKLLWFFIAAIFVSLVAALAGSILLTFIFRRDYLFSEPARVVVPIMAFGALVNGIIGLVMRGFISWYGDIKIKAALAQKNHEMELALIKSQIDPHFLFNTINNIDVLIEKDPTQASAYLNKLSAIMRFMLYETKPAEIPLAKELLYIEKYIDLQKIRVSNTQYVHYSVTGNPANLAIAPMLFIPFVENAFKHTENKKKENAIVIKLAIEKDAYIFDCENVYSSINQQDLVYNGLGNELIKKRLALLYPGRHTLEIKKEDAIYKVKLIVYHHAH